jgi:hypothetical protein
MRGTQINPNVGRKKKKNGEKEWNAKDGDGERGMVRES